MKSILLLFFVVSQAAIANMDIKVAISSAPNNMSPFFSTDANSQNINRLVHMSLIDFNKKMQFECRACKTFEEKLIDGKQVLHFELKDDLIFSDGSKVTSDDVVRSWEYFAKNEKIKSTFMSAFEAIEKILVKSPSSFDIVYKTFSLENLSNIALLKIVKIKNPNAESIDPMDIIGCGDYILSSVSPLEIVTKPKDNKRPNLIFKVVKDETTLALKLINKEVDLSVASMSPRKVNWLKSKSDKLTVWDLPSGNYQFMGLNHKREIFKDLRVRKAISLLIPRQELMKYKLKNTSLLSNGMFSPAFADMYTSDEIEKNDKDLAQKLLAEVGYVKNSKGILEKNGKEFEVEWKVSNNKASIEVVEVMAHFLEKEGIKVQVSIQEWGTFMSAFKKGNFDIVIGQWVGFTGPDMLKFVYHSESTPPKGGNRTSYKNESVDKLLDLATSETKAEVRTKLYREANKLINEDYAAINLWHPSIVWIGTNCLKNISLEPNGSFYPLLSMEYNCGK